MLIITTVALVLLTLALFCVIPLAFALLARWLASLITERR
jgi:hypothetical protein